MAAAGIALGMDPRWALEIAKIAIRYLTTSGGDPKTTIRHVIATRRASPGLGEPADWHESLPPPDHDEAIAAAMTTEWYRR